MKIYGDNQIDAKGVPAGPQKVKKAEKKRENSSAGPITQTTNQTVKKNDKVQISSRGKEIADLMAVTNKLPETRDDKVNAIKNAIKSGTYSVDSQSLAARILKEL